MPSARSGRRATGDRRRPARVLRAQGRGAAAAEPPRGSPRRHPSRTSGRRCCTGSRSRARVAAESGRHAEAEETAREALAIVEKTDLLDLHGDVLVDLAEILRLAGREEEARESAEAALDLYLRKGNDVAADRARALLADAATRA